MIPASLTRRDLHGARVVVLGLGRTGGAVARTLAAWGAVVSASDDRDGVEVPDGIEASVGSHDLAMARIGGADIVVVSPGLPPHARVVAHALASAATVCSDIELASRLVQAPIVVVTGTNGKTSTCELIADALRRSARAVVLCGNEQEPFLSAVAGEGGVDVYVVEASSFALEYTSTIRPRVAVITNLAPDHLDWHGTMADYRAAKAKMAANQGEGDSFIHPLEQPDLAAMAGSGARVHAFSADDGLDGDGSVRDGDVAVVRTAGDVIRVAGVDVLAALGRPFVLDGLAAATAARCLGAAPAAIEASFRAFKPRAHRLTTVAEVSGVRFIDDSKATNPHAAVAALRGFDSVVLIAGGRAKGLDLAPLAAERGRLRAVIATGEAGGEVAAAFDGSGVRVRIVEGLADAVAEAAAIARPGDVVLLSPACASYDQFTDYAERGRTFTDICRTMTESGG